MKITPFKLERYFARYEFSAPYLLSCSDCEPLTMEELLSLSDQETSTLWKQLSLGYTEAQGHPLLREEISKFYASIKANEVLVLTPQEGIFIAMNVLLEPGDHVVSTFPGYQSLYDVARAIGCDVSRWGPKIRDNSWKFDPKDLEAAIKENTKLIVINFPHNPTGALLNRSDYEATINIARERDIVLFSDEMYRFLEFNEKDGLDSASDLYENAISLFGMSKTFGLPGLRIGWLTTKNREIFNQLASFKDYTTICNSAPSEILALVALRAKDKIVAKNMEIISRNLGILDDFFKRFSHVFEWIKPQAGSIAFPKLMLEEGSDAFCSDLVDKQGVMLLPSTVYDYHDNHVRFGFGRKNMPDVIRQLELYLQNKNLV